MFSKAALFTLITLSLLAVANPVAKRDQGIRVPLRKRFAKDDGTFDFEAAISHTAQVKLKYRQNLINLERNVGKQAFSEVRLFGLFNRSFLLTKLFRRAQES
jgi:cathepsin D